MRRGTKKCILLLLAILLLCLLAWRLTPHTFEEMTASDRDEITSLAGGVSLSGDIPRGSGWQSVHGKLCAAKRDAGGHGV